MEFNRKNKIKGSCVNTNPNDPYLHFMANGKKYDNTSLNPNTNVWVAKPKPLDYYVFHGCDGAGIQSDCLGDIKYIERLEFLWPGKNADGGWLDESIKNKATCDTKLDSKWDTKQGSCTLTFDEGLTKNNDKKKTQYVPNNGMCFPHLNQAIDKTKKGSTYCKFIHPGTNRAYNDYWGGWWGSDCGVKYDPKTSPKTHPNWTKTGHKFGDKNMGCIGNDDFKSSASGGGKNWKLVKGPIKSIPTKYWNGRHPFAKEPSANVHRFSFMLYRWVCAYDKALTNTNSFSYPSVPRNGYKCYVDNEPTFEQIEVYFGAFFKDKNVIKLYRYTVTVNEGKVHIKPENKKNAPWVIHQATHDGTSAPW